MKSKEDAQNANPANQKEVVRREEREENMFDKCEFCGIEKELGQSTPFHGFYCMDCMKMNIEYDKESIRGMKPERRKKITNKELDRLKKERDDAVNYLLNFGK